MRTPSPCCALLVGTLGLLCGCAAEVRGLRIQKPFTVAPYGTEVSLVSIDVPEEVAKLSSEEDLKVLVKAGLAKAFAATSFVMVDETSAGQAIQIGPRTAPMPGVPSPGPDVAFVATLPASLPGTGPMVMGVQMVDVARGAEKVVLNGETQETMVRPKITADLVYTLWTRDGREVETRRVQVTGTPNLAFRAGLKIIPSRDPSLSWNDDAMERRRYASRDETHLLAETLEASAAAFLFPYGNRAVWFSALLDESSSELKPGLALSKKGDFEAAFIAFEAASFAAPTLAGAFYNMGVMRELQGRDEDALALYEHAVSLGTLDRPVPEECILQQLKLLERMKNRTALEIR